MKNIVWEKEIKMLGIYKTNDTHTISHTIFLLHNFKGQQNNTKKIRQWRKRVGKERYEK